MLYRTVMATELGSVEVVVDDHGAVKRIEFTGTQRPTGALNGLAERRCAMVVRQLSEYFEGSRHRFELALAPAGSEFQQRVWDRVLRIPYGTTRSYGEIARDLGDIGLARAVGAANGANPIPIIIPCHRVIGADGSLVGYGGGLAVKRRLLELEAGVVGGRQTGLDFG